MCSAPTIPTTPIRQQVQLPNGGTPAAAANTNMWNKTVMAGLMTSPQGTLGTPNIGKSTLG